MVMAAGRRGLLGGRQAKGGIEGAILGEGGQHARLPGLGRVARQGQIGRAQHGEIEGRGIGQAVELATFCPPSALGQLGEGRILGALIAQQIEAEAGLIRLARAELAEDLGLLPIGIGAGDLCVTSSTALQAPSTSPASSSESRRSRAATLSVSCAGIMASSAAASRDSPRDASRSARAAKRLTPLPLPVGASALVSSSRRSRSRIAGEVSAGGNRGRSCSTRARSVSFHMSMGKPPAPSSRVPA